MIGQYHRAIESLRLAAHSFARADRVLDRTPVIDSKFFLSPHGLNAEES